MVKRSECFFTNSFCNPVWKVLCLYASRGHSLKHHQLTGKEWNYLDRSKAEVATEMVTHNIPHGFQGNETVHGNLSWFTWRPALCFFAVWSSRFRCAAQRGRRGENKEQQAVRMWPHPFPQLSGLQLCWLDVILVAVPPTHACPRAQELCGSDAWWAWGLFMLRNGRVRAIDTHQHPAAYYFLPALA